MTVEDMVQDGREHALALVAEQVDAAQDVIRSLVAQDVDRVWSARELQDAAGKDHDWSSSVLSLAFWRLVENDQLHIDDDLRVHAAPAA